MGEAKRKSKIKSSKTSSVKKKKITRSELSSEELLEQILNKKKKIKTVEIDVNKVDVSKLSDDELLDFIMAKKKKKKTTRKRTVSSKEAKTIETENLVAKVQEQLQIEELKKEQELSRLKKEHRKIVIRRIVLSTLCLLFAFVLSLVMNYLKKPDDSYALLEELNLNNDKKLEEDKNLEFNTCLNAEYSDSEENESIVNKKKEIENYLKKHNVSIGYKDLTFGYSYYYQNNEIYYAASTIKSLDALYIYTKAANGELDLDTKLTYTSSLRMGSSIATQRFSYGTKISLRDLVKYAITVSDNSAHNMLVNYIGKSKLREFGKSLGAKTTLNESDIFGSINVSDAMIYMEAIYKFTQENGELGQELASYFIESDDNNLKFEDLGIQALTKYGYYGNYFHNIGVVDSFHPYSLVILTKEGQKNGKEVMIKVSNMIMELHDLYYSNRQSQCLLDVYGK